MSWKSFVTAGLLCALASPVFAAPSIQITPGGTQANGHLDANGDWVWLVTISQTTPLIDVDNGGSLTPGTPMAAELGFRELLGELLAANRTGLEANAWGSSGTAHDNPGNGIFGWEVLTDTDNDGSTGTCGAPPCKFGEVGADTGDEPVGIQTNLTLDEVFSAMGSVDYGNDIDGKAYLRIVIDGPSSAGGASLSTQLQVLGAYGGGGRISELNDNFDPGLDESPTNLFSHNCQQDPSLGSCDVNLAYQGSLTRVAQPGDVNLNGDVDGVDLDLVLQNFFVDDGQRKWFHGDFDGNGDVNGVDLDLTLQNFFAAPYTVFSDSVLGSGGGGGAPVPEPATMAMLALAGLGVVGLRRRRS